MQQGTERHEKMNNKHNFAANILLLNYTVEIIILMTQYDYILYCMTY